MTADHKVLKRSHLARRRFVLNAELRHDQERCGRGNIMSAEVHASVIKAVLVLARQDLGEDVVSVLLDVEKVHLDGRVKPED